jgi:hypothetical protein
MRANNPFHLRNILLEAGPQTWQKLSHRMRIMCHALLATLWCLLTLQTARSAVLTHRYSFDTDASDSVGGANGTLQGAAFITNGTVALNGSNSYVRLPNDLFTNYASCSIEVWFTDASVNTTNSQLYTFSGANGALIYQLDGRGSCISNGIVQQVNLLSPAVGGTNHLIWTQDGTAQTAALYVNGTLAAQNTNFTVTPAGIGSTINDCVGGAGTITTVLNFNGSILEFRIYQGALTPLDVAVLDAFGPDQPQTDPGTLQAVRVAVPSPNGPGALFRASVFADFSVVTNVNINTQPDLVLTSDNPNVIAIAPDRRLQTVALGTANITAMWQGFSNTLAVTVGVPQDVALIHRYGFNEKTNDWIVHDSVGNAHGRLILNSWPAYAAFTGKGELAFTAEGGIDSSDYVALPPGLVSSLSEVSIEAWVTWTEMFRIWDFERIFDFGSSISYVQGVSYLFLTPDYGDGTYGFTCFSITTNSASGETPHLNWTNMLPLNVTSFVAVTYSPVRGIAKYYLNGQLISSGVATIPLSAIVDTNDWLGRSQWWWQDEPFIGRYNEFRIYSGLLSDADAAADYAAGPDAVGVDYVLHAFPSSNALAITWGPSATNLVLQSSPVLGSGAVWNQVSILPILQNGRYGVTVSFSNDAAFYRLRTP